MLNHNLILILCFLSFLNLTHGSFFDLNWIQWPFGQDNSDTKNLPMVAVHVPYEQNAADAKFLADAKKYTDLQLSELDECQHRVVLELKDTCAQLSEEDLGKLGVNLLNCQSLIEGRQTYPCTKKMSLRECTSKMDADTWNSYHLMSNRARAVCFISRQQQFRAMSELTVNRLMNQAHEQTKFMDELARNHANLGGQIENTLNAVNEGKKSLETQQEKMINTQQSLQNFVSSNLKNLAREKALIAAGHTEMARMITEITKRLEDAQKTQDIHADETRETQKLLIKDLEKLEKETRAILQAIEDSTTRLVTQHNEVASQYADTLENLSKINISVSYLTELVENSRVHIDQQYQWLKSWMDTTGQSVDTLVNLFGHGCFLLTAMLILGFISAPAKIRITLIFAWLMNVACILTDRCHGSLNTLEMAIAISTMSLFNWLWSQRPKISSSPKAILNGTSITNKLRSLWTSRKKSQEINQDSDKSERNDLRDQKEDEYETFNYHNNYDSFNYSSLSNHLLNRTRNNYSRSSTPLSNISTSSSRGQQCDAISVHSGRQCRNKVSIGQIYCHTHLKNH